MMSLLCRREERVKRTMSGRKMSGSVTTSPSAKYARCGWSTGSSSPRYVCVNGATTSISLLLLIVSHA